MFLCIGLFIALTSQTPPPPVVCPPGCTDPACVLTPLDYKDLAYRQIPAYDSLEMSVTFYNVSDIDYVDIETSEDGVNWHKAISFIPENVPEATRYFKRFKIVRQ